MPNVADYGVLIDAAGGGTPLSAHMARMAVSQAKRAGHKRRVVFVVTDGGCDWGPKTVKRMAGYLEQSLGTVMAHVSIGAPLRGSFKAEVMVPYGTPLAEVGLEHFTKVPSGALRPRASETGPAAMRALFSYSQATAQTAEGFITNPR